MGEYKEAVASFKQAKVLSPKDQLKTVERHIDEVKVAQSIAESEIQLDKALKSSGNNAFESAAGDVAVGGGSTGNASASAGAGAGAGAGALTSAFKTIERGANKLVRCAFSSTGIYAPDDATGSHACSLEAFACV
jgi:hypothetical protein